MIPVTPSRSALLGLRRQVRLHGSKALLFSALLILLPLCASPASAQTWTGAGDGVDWNDPANWNFLPNPGPNVGLNFVNNALPSSSEICLPLAPALSLSTATV
jgi:hypothetical protein